MKVGVLSDTHIGVKDNPSVLTAIVAEHFSECSAILHAGDLTHLDHFYGIIPDGIPFYAVAGNMDAGTTADQLPRRRIVELGDFRIGIVHGYGSSHEVYRIALEEFEKDDVDAIVFGHSHQAFNKRYNGRLLFNPGSPTDKRFARFRSLGILELGKTIEARIIELED